jgi:hypothetical protein
MASTSSSHTEFSWRSANLGVFSDLAGGAENVTTSQLYFDVVKVFETSPKQPNSLAFN